MNGNNFEFWSHLFVISFDQNIIHQYLKSKNTKKEHRRVKIDDHIFFEGFKDGQKTK